MKKHLAERHYLSDVEVIAALNEMRASIPKGSMDSIIAGGSVWTERETMLKNMPV